MSDILLERSEFLVLMNAVRASAVVGIATDKLFPSKKSKLKAEIERGIDLLKQRGLLRVESGIHVINAELVAMATAIAHPEIAVLTTRDNPGQGQQLFLHYQSDSMVIEQTFPNEREHRLAQIPDTQALVGRIQEILPVTDEPTNSGASATMEQKVFFKVKEYAEKHKRDTAVTTLHQYGLTNGQAEQLIDSIQHPIIGGNVALLKCEGEEIVDARNLALVQGQQSSWSIRQAEQEPQLFIIETTNSSAVRLLLSSWLTELTLVKTT